MNTKKILLYIEPKAVVEPISSFTMSFARLYDARVFALSIIKHPLPEVKTRIEEEAWKRLYEIEEDAFETGVKISLLLEEIDTMTPSALTKKLIDLIQTFQADILIISNNVKLNIKELTGEITIPVIIVPLSHNIISKEV